jgi:hypothetical protein
MKANTYHSSKTYKPFLFRFLPRSTWLPGSGKGGMKMQPSNLMGSPAPTKTGEPPTGEAGEGEIKKLVEEIKMDISDIVSDKVAKALFGENVVSIVPSENEWNAWIENRDGLKSFIAGGYLDYMEMKVKLLFEMVHALHFQFPLWGSLWLVMKMSNIDDFFFFQFPLWGSHISLF